jgi:hypothetical protein
MVMVRGRCADLPHRKIFQKKGNLIKSGFNVSVPLIDAITTFQDAFTMVRIAKTF